MEVSKKTRKNLMSSKTRKKVSSEENNLSLALTTYHPHNNFFLMKNNLRLNDEKCDIWNYYDGRKRNLKNQMFKDSVYGKSRNAFVERPKGERKRFKVGLS